ncbi:hypothetical protein Leryth_018960 [Lithospermum erythrorhizon]|nr:hypothetical protein Leryth_018960 [Lithospermum erythrorhizon]
MEIGELDILGDFVYSTSPVAAFSLLDQGDKGREIIYQEMSDNLGDSLQLIELCKKLQTFSRKSQFNNSLPELLLRGQMSHPLESRLLLDGKWDMNQRNQSGALLTMILEFLLYGDLVLAVCLPPFLRDESSQCYYADPKSMSCSLQQRQRLRAEPQHDVYIFIPSGENDFRNVYYQQQSVIEGRIGDNCL